MRAEAFEQEVASDPSGSLVRSHGPGWVTALESEVLVGFAHAWLQDVMVAVSARHVGVGRRPVATARREAAAGCEWLLVDFDEACVPSYEACGFVSTGESD